VLQYGENEALSGYHYAGMLAGAAMGRALKARVKRLAQVRVRALGGCRALFRGAEPF